MISVDVICLCLDCSLVSQLLFVIVRSGRFKIYHYKSIMEWDREMSLQLIDIYEQHPVLWNQKH
nr:unnamed protein product [Callosobruchus analis]